ncbi:hypothetical protein LR48_Vigan02g145700 [Vigna angularis]|uniref:Uncharacterized protein n=1 Tax=Phaseolus angularis TaxID=3914 RepID=A0A0L9TY20_PHAAN|nr:hypothetical protein LR48_Vigan02g145700 [Vigna angularis]
MAARPQHIIGPLGLNTLGFYKAIAVGLDTATAVGLDTASARIRGPPPIAPETGSRKRSVEARKGASTAGEGVFQDCGGRSLPRSSSAETFWRRLWRARHLSDALGRQQCPTPTNERQLLHVELSQELEVEDTWRLRSGRPAWTVGNLECRTSENSEIFSTLHTLHHFSFLEILSPPSLFISLHLPSKCTPFISSFLCSGTVEGRTASRTTRGNVRLEKTKSFD